MGRLARHGLWLLGGGAFAVSPALAAAFGNEPEYRSTAEAILSSGSLGHAA